MVGGCFLTGIPGAVNSARRTNPWTSVNRIRSAVSPLFKIAGLGDLTQFDAWWGNYLLSASRLVTSTYGSNSSQRLHPFSP